MPIARIGGIAISTLGATAFLVLPWSFPGKPTWPGVSAMILGFILSVCFTFKLMERLRVDEQGVRTLRVGLPDQFLGWDEIIDVGMGATPLGVAPNLLLRDGRIVALDAAASPLDIPSSAARRVVDRIAARLHGQGDRTDPICPS